MKAKIEALLAKANANGVTPEESETYTAKAEELMVKWGIEEAELEAGGQHKAEPIIEVSIDFAATYGPTMVMFAFNICNGFGNLRNLQTSLSGPRGRRRFWIIGHESDVTAVQMLIASLQIQAMRELKAWQKVDEGRKYRTEWENWKANRQFLISFSTAVAKRLRATRVRVEETVTEPGTALVLASKKAKVDAWMDEAHPNLRKARGGQYGSNHGRAAGTAAGERASLGGNEVGGGRGQLSS
jgi:hypothetical protein